MDQASQYKFIVRSPEGSSLDALKAKFLESGVVLGGGVYEVPCHLQPVFQEVACRREDLANAERFCPAHICPPITSGTTSEDVSKINATIVKELK